MNRCMNNHEHVLNCTYSLLWNNESFSAALTHSGFNRTSFDYNLRLAFNGTTIYVDGSGGGCVSYNYIVIFAVYDFFAMHTRCETEYTCS